MLQTIYFSIIKPWIPKYRQSLYIYDCLHKDGGVAWYLVLRGDQVLLLSLLLNQLPPVYRYHNILFCRQFLHI